MRQATIDLNPVPIASEDRYSDLTSRANMRTQRSKNILIVEDEQDVIDLLALHLLKDATYTISTAIDGVAGLEKARAELPWMIILDLMLPRMSGLEVCKILKSDRVTRHIPIIMLTAKAGETDRIAGLELGADDYVTKPFSPREVILRIKAIERRHTAEVADEKLVCGLITVDPIRHHVDVAGRPVRLTTAEFKLLTMLMKKPGRLLSREMLLTGAWGYETYINTRTVDTHIRRLRHKLGKAARTVETVRGFGYRLRES
ncbi:MAG TPA: winged helix-turn-helix domain-containing protein [Chthoniobacterales bacterium]|nr:winged helix-turn-helix domain-containing protein [Chthoniobacterales bacterium]HXY60607.1 winged helix-turn-helix domain-containing protein [Chthoniobacterales bacterium]